MFSSLIIYYDWCIRLVLMYGASSLIVFSNDPLNLSCSLDPRNTNDCV